MNRLRSVLCCCSIAALVVYSLSGGPSPVIGRAVPDHVSGSLRGGGGATYKTISCVGNCALGSDYYTPGDGPATGQCGPKKVACGQDCANLDAEVTPVES